tara:strand:- start:132 stop:284 length:153 start_codon:yes stop_codon:yes gene_type:complete
MNKFFLKLFNKKKYLVYKNRLQEIENFNLYNKIVIPDIKKISLALETKKK